MSPTGGDAVPARSSPIEGSPKGTPDPRQSVDRSPYAARGLLGVSPHSGGPEVRLGNRRRGTVSHATDSVVGPGVTPISPFAGVLGASPPGVAGFRDAGTFVWSHAVAPPCPAGGGSLPGDCSDALRSPPVSCRRVIDEAAGSFAVPPQAPFVAPDSTPPFDDADNSVAIGGTSCSSGNSIVRICVWDACRRRLYALRDAMADLGDQRGPVSDVIDRLLHWSLPAIRAEFGDEVGDAISSSLPSRVCGRDFTLRYMPGDSGVDYGQGGSHGSASGGLGMCSVHKPTFYKFMHTEPGGAEGWNAKVVRQGIKYCELVIDPVMRRGESVTLMVDGRYDSARGAQHCTVTTMEYETRLVVGVHTLRPKIEGKASNALEVPAVVQLLRWLMDKGLKIRCVVSDDCAALGPKLRAMNIEWQKDCHHKIKNIRKHFHSMLQLKEAKKVSSPHDCVSEAQFMQFTKKRLKEALEQRFGPDVLTPVEERLKKSDFVAVVMRKMYPYGSRLNPQAWETDPDGLTEYHAHEVGMWFLRACQLRITLS
ncbi:hypothetical protein CBR_g41734 [Chara braunii]|uniref:Uncharacterized protein n=1 Tax=Chara braunii TaxID=69332 RepID=A0A388LWS8_CHABU|nr:hypothetical protein CBR_g41734 [Chara braunii]|eukprot:GBG86672.1 hypothetical protein CBR_g41734 [Chara braunii]